METDYTLAIVSMVLIAASLTAAVVFVLSRPSDLNQPKP